MHLDKLLTESWCRWGWSGGPVRLRRRWWSPWCRSILKDTWNSFYIPLRHQRTGAQGRRVASDSDLPWRLLNINRQRGRLRSVLALARTSSECSSTEESPDTGWYSCSSVPEGAFCLGQRWEGVLKLAEIQNSHLMSENVLQSMCTSAYYLFSFKPQVTYKECGVLKMKRLINNVCFLGSWSAVRMDESKSWPVFYMSKKYNAAARWVTVGASDQFYLGRLNLLWELLQHCAVT